MAKWRIDIDLYARYVKLENLVLYANFCFRFHSFFFFCQQNCLKVVVELKGKKGRSSALQNNENEEGL